MLESELFQCKRGIVDKETCCRQIVVCNTSSRSGIEYLREYGTRKDGGEEGRVDGKGFGKTAKREKEFGDGG